MFKRILVPTHYSPSPDAALALAREHFPDASRCLLHVLDPERIASSLTSSVSVKVDREGMESVEMARLEELAMSREECQVRVGTPAEIILQEADRWSADLIVMGFRLPNRSRASDSHHTLNVCTFPVRNSANFRLKVLRTSGWNLCNPPVVR